MDEEDESTPESDVYIQMRSSSVNGISAAVQALEDDQSTVPQIVKRREKPVCYLVDYIVVL